MFAESVIILLRNIDYEEERQKEKATKRKTDRTRVHYKNDSSGLIAKYHNVL